MTNDLTNTDYAHEVPAPEDMVLSLSSTLSYWQERNKIIDRMREMVVGLNKIQAPTGTPYKIRTVHTYLLAAIINEKSARFLQQPSVQVIPDDITNESRAKSTRLEKAMAVAFQEMENRGDGDVWSRLVLDAVLLDEGVERIERAPAAFWPEAIDDEGNYIMEGETFKNYKKEQGLPVRSVFVPLENFYPIYEGSTIVESFELEQRSLRDILRNKTFNTEAITNAASPGSDKGLSTQVTVVHYSNLHWHAYFALSPDGQGKWPDIVKNPLASVGVPMLLHSYRHGLGRSIYNTVAGRFGGWKSSDNRIEGINKGLMELNQAADEVFSQVVTNIRARNWPNLAQTFDPDHREPMGGSNPKPQNIPEGHSIGLWKGETIEPIFKAEQDPAVPWVFDRIQEQIGRLGGSPVLFGAQQPGVETGYHQALQITQSEHLDEKLEQHLSTGAASRGLLVLSHVRKMDEEVIVHEVTTDTAGRKQGEYFTLDPVDLTPMPRLDASVRKPRPVDFAAAMRTAREASDEREGKGPLLSDDTIREELLNRTAPDEERFKVIIQKERNKILESGIINAKVSEALNLKLAQTNVPEISPDDAASADPAALQALAKIQRNQAAAAGGLGPGTANTAGGTSLDTGMPVGQSQPEANAGQEISIAERV